MTVEQLIERLSAVKDKKLQIRCYTDEGSVDIDHGAVEFIHVGRNDDNIVSIMLEQD